MTFPYRSRVPRVRVGAGSYGDGASTVYTDSNGVMWTIVDNDCGGLGGALDTECSMTDIQNRYWAQQPAEKRYAFDPVPSLRAMTLDGARVLVDKFAATHAPLGGETSGGTDVGPGSGGDGIEKMDPKPVDVRAPASAPASYSASASGASSSDPSFANIQRALLRLGYNVGPTGADGKPGPNTSAAIVKFKRDHGLPANDTIDDGFRGALAVAQQGKTGPGAGAGTSWTTYAYVTAAVAGAAVLAVWAARKWLPL